MKVYENISSCSCNEVDKATLTRVINELIPLRKSRKHTVNYYDTFLSADIRKRQLENKKDFFLNDREIEVSKAKEFRRSLLDVILDDKESFGYLYFLLGSEVNREYKAVMYECVPLSKTISYCVDFDLDELQSRLNNELDLKQRLDIIKKQTQESNKHQYTGEYKDRFEKFCKSEIEMINQEVAMQTTTTVKQNETSTATELPKELQTDKAKALFQRAIKAGFITKENDIYKWNFEQHTGQLLAYFCQRASHYLNLSKKIDKDGNNTVSWKVFEKLFGVKNIISLKNDWMKYNTKFTPRNYEEIDKLFDI